MSELKIAIVGMDTSHVAENLTAVLNNKEDGEIIGVDCLRCCWIKNKGRN